MGNVSSELENFFYSLLIAVKSFWDVGEENGPARLVVRMKKRLFFQHSPQNSQHQEL
jgi:hypothetical protein